MDLPQQEENIQEDNPNSGSLGDSTNEEKTSCSENNNSEIPGFLDNNSGEKDAPVSSEITGENNSAQNPEDNSKNNNPVDVVSDLEKSQEDRPQQDEAMVVTEEKGETLSSDNKEISKPVGFSSDNLKPSEDNDSVDSSSDSSSSSTTSSSSSSSDEDEMDDDDDDEDEVKNPKISPEKQKSHENGISTIPHFRTYRNYKDDESSDDSSSESTSSSSSETEDTVPQVRPTNRPRRDSDGEERVSRPRVKGEIFPEELPALENLNVSVKDTVDLKILGKVTSVIKNIAVVKAEYSCPIDQDSVIFLKDRTCVGKVHDIFGPVREPFYTVHLDKNYTMIPLDTVIYCAPEEREFTNYVFVNDLKNLKGSDASWEHDIEPPEKFVDFSDDEQERQMKKKNRCKNSANDDSTNDDSNDKNGKSQQNRFGSSSVPGNSKKWRKKDQSRGANSKSLSGTNDASQKSMFAFSNKWPPGNEHCNYSSWPPPPHTPPPPPPPPPPPHPHDPTFPNYNNPNSMMWPPNHPWTYPPTDMSPFRSPWSSHQNQSNMGLYLGGGPNYSPSGNSFVPPPPSHPWFQGARRPPHGPQGPHGFMRNPLPPPPPPRFSQPPQFPGVFP